MIEFRLPSLGADMDQGTLLEWKVQPGDPVARGQVVAVVDTAKAAIDVECWREGVVHALLVEPGATLPVGAAMAVLREAGEGVEALERARTARKSTSASATAAATVRAAPIAAAPTVAAAASDRAPAAATAQPARPRVSPLARRRAQELGIDLIQIGGRGAQGAVTLADVEAAHAGAPRKSPSKTPKAAPTLSRAVEMRRVIGAAMSRSKREIPHYYLAEDIDFGEARNWLAERNRDRPVTQRLLPAALLLKAVALALQRYPEFNGYWRDDGFVAGGGVHLGIAVSLREGGLVAPALRDVPALDLDALTPALLDLVKRARAGGLRSSEMTDATITVTNLGDQGVDSVFGVIYPPQVALIGFGRIAERAVVGPDGGLRAQPMVTATLAADHRASDGHRGALLLAEIGAQLQDPQALDEQEKAA